MIEFQLNVEDLADTRFAVSPLAEAVFSLWVLADPGGNALHLTWRRSVVADLGRLDAELLLGLVGPTLAIPDFLTPRPTTYAPAFTDELATVAATPPSIVVSDFEAAYAPHPLPASLRLATVTDTAAAALLVRICDELHRYWDTALAPGWAQQRLVLEADMTYRARQLAIGGARLLFADLHPNVRWTDGVLHIGKMIGQHRVLAAGRGLLLVPSIFAYKAIPPIGVDRAPWLAYPARGRGSLGQSPPAASGSLSALLGAPRARLLTMLDDPQTTAELARRCAVTPSAVSQHLKILHAAGLLARTRDRRQVLYCRTALADHLIETGR